MAKANNIIEIVKNTQESSQTLLQKIKGSQSKISDNLAFIRQNEAELLKAEEEKRRLIQVAAAQQAEKQQPVVEEVQGQAEQETSSAPVKPDLPQQEQSAAQTPVQAAPEQVAQETERQPVQSEQRPQGDRGFQGQRSQDNRGFQGQRPQGDRGFQGQRPQGDRGFQGQRPQGDRGFQGQRPQGDRGFQGQRPQGDRGFQGQRPQGDRGFQGQRPQGDRGFQGQRPQGDRLGTRRPAGIKSAGPAPIAGAPPVKEKVSNYDPNRGNYNRNHDGDKKARPRRSPMKENVRLDDDGRRYRRPKSRKAVPEPTRTVIEPIKIVKATITGETVMIKDLAEKIGKPASEIIKKLLILGVIATINQDIDYDTAVLVASEFGVELEQKLEKTFEDALIEEDKQDAPEELVERPPVVTIMGHVDHGKTSILDAIRHTKVTGDEAGGITQQIGAYMITLNDKKITFLDTPGHEAFTTMRARGAQATDVAILVVAADDGVMPQTVEAINHAKAANVPIIVAINKIDKEGANPERVKQNLTEHGLLSEEWGGDTIMVPVSATTGQGIDQLLEMVLLVAEVLELKANPNRQAKGTIIETKLDKGRGPVATVLVQNGTLNVGDTVVAGTTFGRVRAMMNERGERLQSAGPSYPVEVLGLSSLPAPSDLLYAVSEDRLSRQVAQERKNKQRAEQSKLASMISLDDLFTRISQGEVKDLNLVIKCDVQGSIEALRTALLKLSNDEVRVNVIHAGVGAITESDVMLASTANAIIIGFNVRPDAKTRAFAEAEKIDVRLYRVIYNAIEDIDKALKGMLAPVFREVVVGHVEVRNIFKASDIGTIAGCYVTNGKVTRGAQMRIVRDGIVVHEGKIASLKRFKNDAREVAAGYECGISIENYNDIKEGDVFEIFMNEEVKPN
ncbi:MAG: translation initiation factor IF-2 [Christensenellales bacterium]